MLVFKRKEAHKLPSVGTKWKFRLRRVTNIFSNRHWQVSDVAGDFFALLADGTVLRSWATDILRGCGVLGR